jgi:hypothetical protein
MLGGKCLIAWSKGIDSLVVFRQGNLYANDFEQTYEIARDSSQHSAVNCHLQCICDIIKKLSRRLVDVGQ